MKQKHEKLLVSSDLSIKSALKQMGEAGQRILFVINSDGALLGTVADGDVRRWLLTEGSILENISSIYNKTPKYVNVGYKIDEVKRKMVEEKIEVLPVINREGRIEDILLWNNIFGKDVEAAIEKIDIPLLVMAGGMGTRMDPFTRILPKPLIPLGEKPVIEIILDRFAEYGCNEFHLTLNYKGKMIQSYFDNAECKYNIKFHWEDKFCGTAGGIKLVHDHIKSRCIFVSNCDILVKADYYDILKFHESSNNDITLVGSLKHFTVPYGVLDMKDGGVLNSIIEKPEYDFIANTGLYVVDKDVINNIPADTKYDFPELINKVKTMGGKVGIYPVGQHSWIDIGQWQEYHSSIKEFEK